MSLRRAGPSVALSLLLLGCSAGGAPDELRAAAVPTWAPLPAAGEPVDLDVVTAIRAEGLQRSQVMDTLWHLTDLHGPRLTNSPQQRRAAEWTAERLASYGLVNVDLEPWGEFGLGWSFERCVIELTVPDYMPLIAIPKAWTSGTDGVISGEPLLVTARTAAEVEALRGTLAGRVVLHGPEREIPAHFEPTARRHDDESLAGLAARPEADDPVTAEQEASRAQSRARRDVSRALAKLLAEERAALLIEADAGRRGDYGVIMLGSGGDRGPDDERAAPAVVVAAEQFQRLARLIEAGQRVEVRAEVATTFHPDTIAANVVAEVPGGDPALAGETVILGAHFDSWHPATGATDNGASCAVMIEAMRILAGLPERPRRTIRIVLWTGEEQGLLGSKAYVAQHFGNVETMELLPEHGQLAAYFNLDNGAGRIRGVYCEGNAAVQPIFSAWMEPFHDLGARTLTLRGTSGTDHRSFDAIGLPGFQFIQDPMDYSSRTHHTNQDTYERVVEEDLLRSAVIVASFAWHAATRDEKLPRKPLPVPPPAREAEAAPAPTPGGPAPAASGEPAPVAPAPAGPTLDDARAGLVAAVVEAACGQCQFGLPGDDCDLAVRIGDQAFFVDGSGIDDHGDAHAAAGFCNAVRPFTVDGRLVGERFVVTAMAAAPGN